MEEKAHKSTKMGRRRCGGGKTLVPRSGWIKDATSKNQLLRIDIIISGSTRAYQSHPPSPSPPQKN